MNERSKLERVGLFAGLAPHELELLAQRLRRRRYDRNHIIFSRGDSVDCLYLIESGRVRISVGSSEGKELVLNVLGPGEFFGELALLDGEPRSADAVVVEESQLLLLWRDDFVRFVEERPSLAQLGRPAHAGEQHGHDATLFGHAYSP